MNYISTNIYDIFHLKISQFALLCTINGVSGTKNGGKIVKSIADSIIEPTKQYLFSMTGRGNKPAFNCYTEIIALIFAVCNKAATTYSIKDCTYDLTYKIFKHGNGKREKDLSERSLMHQESNGHHSVQNATGDSKVLSKTSTEHLMSTQTNGFCTQTKPQREIMPSTSAHELTTTNLNINSNDLFKLLQQFQNQS